jgi:hypothetical protein
LGGGGAAGAAGGAGGGIGAQNQEMLNKMEASLKEQQAMSMETMLLTNKYKPGTDALKQGNAR